MKQRIEEGLALERCRHSSMTAKKIDDRAKKSVKEFLYHPRIDVWSKEFQVSSTAARH